MGIEQFSARLFKYEVAPLRGRASLGADGLGADGLDKFTLRVREQRISKVVLGLPFGQRCRRIVSEPIDAVSKLLELGHGVSEVACLLIAASYM
jgi:hypothetical protein